MGTITKGQTDSSCSICSSHGSLGRIKTWREEKRWAFQAAGTARAKARRLGAGVVSLIPDPYNQKSHRRSLVQRDSPTGGQSPQLPPSSPSPRCRRCQPGPGAGPAAELRSLKGPPWAKPCHVLGLAKRGGAPWLGVEDSSGPGGNFDYGHSALAGMPRALAGQTMQLLPSRRYTHSSHLERGARQPPAMRPEGSEMPQVFGERPSGPVLSQASQARNATFRAELRVTAPTYPVLTVPGDRRPPS